MGWKVIENKKQVVKRATSFTLDVSDLTELCKPTSYLTDSLINYGVAVYQPAQIAAYGWEHNGVAWFAPTLIVAAKDGSDDQFAPTLGEALGPVQRLDDATLPLPGGANVLLFPVNTSERHWSLLAFYESDRTFVHYDSLGESNTGAAAALIKKLKQNGYLSRVLVPVSPPEIARQEDGYNCGAYVIQYARKIMEVGRKLTGLEIAAITSATSDKLREDMLIALQPFVGFEIYQPLQPSNPKDSGDYVAPKSAATTKEEIEEERKEAIAKLQETLEKQEPVSIKNRATCPRATPATVIVVISSEDPAIQDVVSAKVTFVLNGQYITRKATPALSGKTWTVGISLQCDAEVAVAVRATVGPGAEFVDDMKAHHWKEASGAELLPIMPGDKKQVDLVFTPKPPRRLHAKVGVQVDKDPEKNKEKDKEKDAAKDAAKDAETRNFPDGFKVELVFDGGPDKRAATLKGGAAVDDIDGAAGIRVPYRYKTASLRFPASKKAQKLSSKKDSEATTLVDVKPKAEGDTTPVPVDKDELLGWAVPKGVWSPFARGQWTLPKEHTQDDKLEPHVDVDDNPLPWTIDAPLVYVLEAEPRRCLMNGHEIEHVVVLMLENRGFDHFMGYLYEGTQRPSYNYPSDPVGKHAGLRDFEGLEGVNPDFHFDYSYEGLRGHYTMRENVKLRITSADTGGPLRLHRGARQSNMPQTANPHEDFVHIFQDMYYVDEHTMDAKGNVLGRNLATFETAKSRNDAVKPHGTYRVPGMVGWCQNYCDGIRHHRGEGDSPTSTFTELTRGMVEEILDMYLPDQLPVMSGLARHYGVSDLWFCSVPSQTNTNRAFWVAGSAAGLVKNDFYKESWGMAVASDTLPKGGSDGMLHRRCLFDVLEENDVTWKYYWSCHWPPRYLPNSNINGNYLKIMFPQLNDGKYLPNTPKISEFFEDVRNKTLPTVTYLEPTYGGGYAWDSAKRTVANEFHPVCDMFNGEFFVKQIYDALSADEDLWAKTVFMVTFDENGGTYDHFPPWEALPTRREPTTGKRTEYGFEFDCFGVRVPTLLMSKYVLPGTVYRSPTDVPFDHTSVISTILKWQGIDKETWLLGDRVDNAPTWDGALQGKGDDPNEDQRRQNATGMRLFDKKREARIKGQKPLQYGQDLHLKYVGNIWDGARPPATYLGGPLRSGHGETKPETLESSRGRWRWHSKNPIVRLECWATGISFDDWVEEQAAVTADIQDWYPTVAPDAGSALKFKLRGKSGDVKAGDNVTIELAEGDLCNGFTLAVPEAPLYSTVYLYDGDKPSEWALWLANDRVAGAPLHEGDDIFIFSARYMPENLSKMGLEFQTYDSYQRLWLDTAGGYAKYRPAFWDIWRLEIAP